jgi:hypothetical protein
LPADVTEGLVNCAKHCSYVEIAERIIGRKLVIPTNPEEEILTVLRDVFKIVE